MTVVLYVIGLVLALPAAAFAGLMLVVEHVVEVRNLIKLCLDFLNAVGWGVPIILLALIALVVMAFFKPGQLLGSSCLVIANVAAIVIIVRTAGPPTDLSEAVFLLPAVLSMVLCGYVVWTHAQARSPATQMPMNVMSAKSREVQL